MVASRFLGRLSLHPTAAALCSTSPAARWSRLGSCVSAHCHTFCKPTKSRRGGRVSISWQAEPCARLLPRQAQRRLRRGGRQAEPAPGCYRIRPNVACGAVVGKLSLHPVAAAPTSTSPAARWSRLGSCVSAYCRTFNKPTKSRRGGRVSISWQAEPAPDCCRAMLDVACGAMVAPWLLRCCALPNLLQTDEIETRWSRLDFYVCSFVFYRTYKKRPERFEPFRVLGLSFIPRRLP